MDSPVRQTSARLLKMGFGLPLYIRPFTDSRHGPDDITRLQCPFLLNKLALEGINVPAVLTGSLQMVLTYPHQLRLQ
ncbi:hypothetical protein GCE9029_00806 [Grimontia celer]|uniref:Uncharacterized protein n=1 Tax=Grimontia celer TaxID=1796497 RepID=A0A128EWJ1_9GAMM|nr:hypothetical protein GCE9029_00806 [Grimontia celer]